MQYVQHQYSIIHALPIGYRSVSGGYNYKILPENYQLIARIRATDYGRDGNGQPLARGVRSRPWRRFNAVSGSWVDHVDV